VSDLSGLSASIRRANPRELLKKIPRSVSLWVGVMMLAAVIAGALLASHYSDDPLAMVATPFQWPGQDPAFPLGTDIMGRDLTAGLLAGARVSLVIGLEAGIAAALFGLIVGAVSGYFGGWVDDVLMRLAEVFQIMPALLFTIVVVIVLQPSVNSIVAGIAVTSWPQVARLVRAEALRLRRAEFVQAAVVIGMRPWRIVLAHIVPNTLSPAVVMTSILAGNAILTEAVLAFLGLGDPNVVSWGSMIGTGRDALRSAWYMTAIPGAAIFVTVLALNLLGNGLNDLLNPRDREDH
jgi:peptide/nickel transport system permease protein